MTHALRRIRLICFRFSPHSICHPIATSWPRSCWSMLSVPNLLQPRQIRKRCRQWQLTHPTALLLLAVLAASALTFFYVNNLVQRRMEQRHFVKQYATSRVLSEFVRSRVALSMLPELDSEINGNDGAAVLRYAPSIYNVTRLPEFDHEDGTAFYTELRDAIVSGKSAKLYTSDAVYFPGGCHGDLDPFPIDVVRRTGPADIIHIDHALIIAQVCGEAYYHWMIEGFPKIALMLDYIKAHPDLKIVMHHHQVAATALSLLGISTDRMVWYDPKSVYFVRNAVVPSPSGCGYAISTAVSRLKKLLRDAVRIQHPYLIRTTTPKPFTVVVQSRGNSYRSVTNHAELMEALRRAQPDAVVLEFGPGEDLLSTAAKHYNADIVIGPHGAGLSNIVFAPEGSSLIELHPKVGNCASEGPRHINGCHQRTAKRSGMTSIMFVEDNGDSGSKFTANVTRVVDAVNRIRFRRSLDDLDQYCSWAF